MRCIAAWQMQQYASPTGTGNTTSPQTQIKNKMPPAAAVAYWPIFFNTTDVLMAAA